MTGTHEQAPTMLEAIAGQARVLREQKREDDVFESLIWKATLKKDWKTLRSWFMAYGFVLTEREEEAQA